MGQSSTGSEKSRQMSVPGEGSATRAGDGTPRVFIPPADILDSQEAIIVVLDMPGVTENQVDIHLERNTLTVSAQPALADSEGRAWQIREFGRKAFHRSFTLTDGVDSERITAQMRDGVLRVELPKSAETKPRKIAVKTQ